MLNSVKTKIVALISGIGLTALTATGIVFKDSIFGAPPKDLKPLTAQELQSFTNSIGHEKCYSFLSDEDKNSLLFVCIKKSETQIQEMQGKNIYDETFYYYNGRDWKKAINIKKETNSIIVEVENGLKGVIKDQDSQLKESVIFNLDDECEVLSESTDNTKTLQCTDNKSNTDDTHSNTVTLTLKEFSDSIQPTQ